jgi:predicted RNA binding protein YcfA (HicA-like mRNA interferase family)
MSKLEKLIHKVKNEQSISYEEAEKLLLRLGFDLRTKGSHHVFAKEGYGKTISLKRRSQLMHYQILLVKEAMEYYENKK